MDEEPDDLEKFCKFATFLSDKLDNGEEVSEHLQTLRNKSIRAAINSEDESNLPSLLYKTIIKKNNELLHSRANSHVEFSETSRIFHTSIDKQQTTTFNSPPSPETNRSKTEVLISFPYLIIMALLSILAYIYYVQVYSLCTDPIW